MARSIDADKHVVSCSVGLADAGSINWVAFTRKGEVKHGAHIGETSRQSGFGSCAAGDAEG